MTYDDHQHVREEDLILHYYGETPDEIPVVRHLAVCRRCAEEFERLRQVLSLVDTQEIPSPDPGLERRIWARLEPQLAGHRTSWFARLFASPPRLALAGGLIALVVAAFVAGRWLRTVDPAPPSAVASSNVAERVLLVAVVDHLDRSEMVLVELLNADPREPGTLQSEQLRARELVTANRLYRQTAVQTGDERTREVLDELERVLLEIANTPPEVTADHLEALRARIESRGLLFRVRVVHSEMRERERRTLPPGSTS
jgi:hypothetical protein